ncbi:UDP-glucose--hexose-1-phosphate uridylyltransferase [Secundilactobacillus kimchicus]|uniref:UDP-glucose--hexose-1-phosphate uridylyltransferase n=1 Tax=Secundilactobacillus kimchicus TaxID=528209 RepID=UPI001C018D8D|nr:UDP-glucose--hexose-1-phosphate uridylyltransferase [Secundilactobacillus kimchicus]MBT9672088.1 UDP-glucose--hexose-1-phosphate uridylyltransferase [Secundilactobacillus kimchicus]
MTDTVKAFVNVIINSGTYEPLDRIYVTNKVLGFVGDQPAVEPVSLDILDLLSALISTAIENGKIEDTPSDRDILEAQLTDLMTPTPATVNASFWNRYADDPKVATDYFYKLSRKNNYIKTRAIAKNVSFKTPTDYGDLEITINLSKPEKDPKAIAAARNQTSHTYPLSQLAIENEGYRGRLGFPARSNHRIIRLTLGGETWGFQYSPYAYFNEHAIFLAAAHKPMVINQHTFTNLLSIVRLLPHYFVGSNADLPIVGGSMLAQDHYQGGRHEFPMMKAPVERVVTLPGFADVSAGIVKWPMSTIRLKAANQESLINAANQIAESWQHYSDESVDVRAYTGEVRHHTVTPIAYRQSDQYVLDIVLRDNQTSAEFPDGIFHPHPDVQHIKKENIGLIEVMGRAILPARLKTEMQEVKKYLLGQTNEMADYHREWADALKATTPITADNVDDVINQALGDVFARVLTDAGVFKRDAQGQHAFDRFIDQL